MAGDTATGIAIMQMEPGLDTGPVLLERRLTIGAEETAGELHDRLAALGAEAIVEALARLDELTPVPQTEEGVTYAAKIDKAEARIDWTKPAEEVDRLIRGLSPFPGAWTEIAGHRVKLLGARLAEGAGAPGEVLDEAFTVACGTGAVQVTRAQREGRGPQEAGAFLRGLAVPRGTRLGG
jgi:methionyl-tRNA formyltransferase